AYFKFLRPHHVVPKLASTTQPTDNHCNRLSCSDSKSSPESAAKAGCKLVRMLKVCVGNRLIAIISSENGSAEERMATQSAKKKTEELTCCSPPSASAKGITRTLAITRPAATACRPSSTADTLRPITIYTAQNIPAAEANTSPSTSVSCSPQGTMSKIPAQARLDHKISNHFLENKKARKSGPINSTVTPKPRGMRCIAI